MRKNKINILLIVVVTAIWGFVILKATGNLFASDEETALQEDTALPTPVPMQKKVKHQLQLNYKDPFLGTAVKSEIKKIPENNSRIKTDKTKTEKPLAKEFPIVKFYGLVRNTGTNKMVAIVSVNSKEKRMLTGEIFNEVKLEKITRDSVLVSWNKSKQYIKK